MSESLIVIGRYILGIVICRIWGYAIWFLCDHMKWFGVFLSVVAIGCNMISFFTGEIFIVDQDEPRIRKILFIYLYMVSPVLMLVGIIMNNA